MKELAINGGEPTSLKVLGYGHQDINEDDIKWKIACAVTT
jgi:perosamine synthetase